jgi:hypothetical protein
MAPGWVPIAPIAPIVGIVPGIDGVMGMRVDDPAGLGGIRRLLADVIWAWASAMPQPSRATANMVRRKRCIQASCAGTFRFPRLVVAERRATGHRTKGRIAGDRPHF